MFPEGQTLCKAQEHVPQASTTSGMIASALRMEFFLGGGFPPQEREIILPWIWDILGEWPKFSVFFFLSFQY